MSATMTVTNREVLTRYNIDAHGIEHLDMDVPILSEPQAQGDVSLFPADLNPAEMKPIPAEGIVVVQGENVGGHAHVLHSLDGECLWAADPEAATGLTQGYLHVPEGSSATLIHTYDHNVIGIGPGNYKIKRQREMRNEWMRVAD